MLSVRRLISTSPACIQQRQLAITGRHSDRETNSYDKNNQGTPASPPPLPLPSPSCLSTNGEDRGSAIQNVCRCVAVNRFQIMHQIPIKPALPTPISNKRNITDSIIPGPEHTHTHSGANAYENAHTLIRGKPAN